jgi:Ni/Co efflux regulator RcnB
LDLEYLMRKFLIPLLLASVALPATAQARPDNDGDRREHSAEHRSERSNDRPQRAERVQRADRPAQPERSERAVRFERAERNDGVRVVRRDRQERTEVRRRTDGTFTGVPQRTVERQVRTSDRHQRWSSDWRRDHRYDWRNYRDRHRSLFRLSRYFDPYGYNYRRFSIGFNLGSSYYGSNYWLDDPWMYRLPPAYGPYRWVRYYDDALLVNIYTGQVADVLYNFFW